MKNTLKQKDKNSKDEVNQLKAKLRKVERESRTTNQSKDKEAENAIHLAETQVRMALEEKFNEMWQPAEVLNRIASFIDSGTGGQFAQWKYWRTLWCVSCSIFASTSKNQLHARSSPIYNKNVHHATQHNVHSRCIPDVLAGCRPIAVRSWNTGAIGP